MRPHLPAEVDIFLALSSVGLQPQQQPVGFLSLLPSVSKARGGQATKVFDNLALPEGEGPAHIYQPATLQKPLHAAWEVPGNCKGKVLNGWIDGALPGARRNNMKYGQKQKALRRFPSGMRS